MRIIIDLQGAQGESKYRGIGRYSLAIAEAIARNRGHHEVILALNGLLPDSIEPIRAKFDKLLPQENICVWYAPNHINDFGKIDSWKKKTVELIREAFLVSLKPDIVLITSIFEGYTDTAIHSINMLSLPIFTSVILYDLIPLIQYDQYLESNPEYSLFYKTQLSHLEKANLFLAISESSKQEAIHHLNIKPEQVINISSAVDSIFKSITISQEEEAIIRKHFGLIRPFLMYSGAMDERKNILRLIKAYSILPFTFRKKYQLAIVGGLQNIDRKRLAKQMKTCGLTSNEVIITGRVTDKELVQLYNLTHLFVFPSWHEGFGLPILEAMSCGAPVLGANTTSIPEVIERSDSLFNPFDEKDISSKIQNVLENENLRQKLIQHSLMQCQKFSWDETALKVLNTFEKQHINISKEGDCLSLLLDSIAKLDNPPKSKKDCMIIAESIAKNHFLLQQKRLFIDISELVQRDAKSGVQRVVWSILKEIITNPPLGYEVKLVYAKEDSLNYLYANEFTEQYLGCSNNIMSDEPIDAYNGDIFLILDLQPTIIPKQLRYFTELRNRGIRVYTVVYDLLPILHPGFFVYGTQKGHEKWLQTIIQLDGALCISESVSLELNTWIQKQKLQQLRSFDIQWFHLGADIINGHPSPSLPENTESVLHRLKSKLTFLMIGTIEPRKGHQQTIEAFEKLWSEGMDFNLVIVGKQGWMVELLVKTIHNHTESNKRLIWLEGISDEYLEKVYVASTCLIAASEGEGFGLPLIEAAQHHLPIIARDIPVFREVAGEHAHYFPNTNDPSVLACAIQAWLKLYKQNNHPKSDNMPRLTWKESTKQLLKCLKLE